MLNIVSSSFSPPLINPGLNFAMSSPLPGQKAAQDFLDRLADSLQKLPPQYSTQEELATAAGVSGATISDYKNRKRREAPQFREVFQVAYALLGKPPLFFNAFLTEMEPHHIAIPLVSEAIAAGTQGRIPGDAIESYLYLPKGYLHGHEVIAVRLADNADSMLPSLRPGDLVIIDRADQELSSKGFYAVRLSDLESCAIKRLQLLPDGKHMLLISDNPAYPPKPVEWHEHLIIGRVIWSMSQWLK